MDDSPLAGVEGIEKIWRSILADPAQHYFTVEVGGRLVASCVLIVILNLTRRARPYGLIENVVTHPDFRNRGCATALLRHVRQFAWSEGCYKLMLMTGRKDEATLRFYRNAGFESDGKTAFIAYP